MFHLKFMLMGGKLTKSLSVLTLLLFSLTTVSINAWGKSEGFPFKVRKVGQSSNSFGKTLPLVSNRKSQVSGNSPIYRSSDGTVLYGNVIYADNWTDQAQHYGVYSLPLSGNSKLTSIHESSDFACNSGAIYRKGTFSLLNATVASDGTLSGIRYQAYDTESWERTSEKTFSDIGYMATDLAVDPLTNEIYGSFSDGKGGTNLAKVDFEAETNDVIGSLSVYLVAVAINREGRIYGVGIDGNLYSVDRSTARLTKIGATGVAPAAYLQSATFDWKSGKLYWAATTTANIGALYELDTTTGKATLLSTFLFNEEIVGLYCTNELASEGSPAAATGLSANFEGASLKGTLSFTLPQKDNKGNDLNAQLDYKVTANGINVAEGKGQPGEDITTGEVTLKAGMTTLKVVASNSAGDGLPAILDKWIGFDAPEAVSGLTVKYADGMAEISWKAPSEGIHGGYLDAAALKYNIVRYPDSVEVAKNLTATSYKDNFNPEQLAAYKYKVTAFAGDLEGGVAVSDNFAAGSSITPPYMQMFDDEAQFSLMKVVDANNDGYTWTLDKAGKYVEIFPDDYANGNDWLITPSIKLGTDRFYKISFDALAPYGGNWPESLEVKYGKGQSVEAMTNELVTDTVMYDIRTFHIGKYFTVSAADEYNFGLHATSSEIVRLRVDSLLIEPGPYFDAPDSVKNLRVETDATGKLAATLTFTTPDKTATGNALASITKVEVYRAGKLIGAIDNPATGKEATFEDKNAAHGFNSYKVVAFNSVGEGYPVYAELFVGEDVPDVPRNVRLLYDKGGAKLVWDAPAKGKNGGWIDASSLVYAVKDNSNNVKAYDSPETTLTDYLNNEADQSLLQYAVFAGNAQGYGESTVSNTIVKGKSYEMPWQESFNDGSYHSFWNTVKEPHQFASWVLNSGKDADGTNGQLAFNAGNEGEEAVAYTGKVDISEAATPVLEFYYWYLAKSGDKPLDVKLYKDSNDTITLASIKYDQPSAGRKFKFMRIPLSEYTNSDYIQIGFHGVSSDAITTAAIDGLKIREWFNHDLHVSASLPSSAKAGDSIVVAATVKNVGAQKAEDYDMELWSGGQLVATQPGMAIEPDSVASVSFKVKIGTLSENPEYVVVANYADDDDTENNASDTLAVVVELPSYPAPSALQGTRRNGIVELSWQEPDYADFSLPTADGAEQYTSFAISDLGDWTLRDNDGLNTKDNVKVAQYYGIDFDHEGEPMSFIVMDPAKCGARYTDFMGRDTGWKPYEGEKYFASFGNLDGANDDWLISPELTGDAQTLTFAVHGYNSESYEVLYSTTDTALTSFVRLDSVAAPGSWTTVSYELPQGARYFAIRHVTKENSYLLFIDDIRFMAESGKGALEMSGYNVYRDGLKLNDAPLTSAEYADKGAGEGRHRYDVTAVYSLGESTPASFDLDETTGISDAAYGQPASVPTVRFDTSGRRVAGKVRGLNIVRMSDGSVRKVMER